MDADLETEQCFLCRQFKAYGSGRYELQWYKSWQILVCSSCREGNWDGIAHEDKISKLFAHFDKKRIERPERNEKGWIDLPPMGS